MKRTFFQTLTLGLSGITALAIGGMITLAPHSFYASYGITLAQDPNLLSELRAPGAGLAALGMVMLAGLVRTAMTPVALVTALVVFLAFPAGRLVGLALDGIPSGSILGALVVELVIAGLLLAAFAPRRASRAAALVPRSG